MATIWIKSILILCEVLAMGASQDAPYKVDVSYNDNDKRNLTLYCKDIVGMAVEDAMFYRNGADPKTDECLNTTVYSVDSQKGRISLVAKSECDGYYMCGVKDGAKYILSGPRTIYTPPREIGNGRETKNVEDGETVTLPCKISSSPLNMYTTTWYRYHQGSGGQIKGPTHTTGSDNSLVLKNVRYGVDQGVYHCRVVVDKPEQGTLMSSGNNGVIDLKIYRKFFPPVFVTNLTYNMDEHGIAHFTATAAENEHYPIHYQWSVNGAQYNSDGDKIDVKSVNYGITIVSVTIWNEKYTGSRYSEELDLVVFVDRIKTQDCNDTVKYCDNEEKEGKFLSGYKDFVIVILAVVLFVSIFIIFISSPVMFWHCCKQRKSKSNDRKDCTSPDHLQNIFIHVGTYASTQVKEKPTDLAIMTSLQELLTDIHKEAKTQQAKETLRSMLTDISNEIINLLSTEEQLPEICRNLSCPNSDHTTSDVNLNREEETNLDKEQTERVCDPTCIRRVKLEKFKDVVSHLLSGLEPKCNQ